MFIKVSFRSSLNVLKITFVSSSARIFTQTFWTSVHFHKLTNDAIGIIVVFYKLHSKGFDFVIRVFRVLYVVCALYVLFD